MSIIQVEHRRVGRANLNNRLSWQRRFKINLYKINYADTIKNRVETTPLLEDHKNQAVNAIVGFINEGKTKNLSDYQKKKYFYDPQFVQNCFSPYSAFIPLQDESYLYDEAIYSFSYMGHLKDASKRNQLDKYYQDIHMYFQQGKKRGKQYVLEQWMKVKLQYLVSIDSVKAASIFIQILKKNSKDMQQLYKKYGNQSKRQIFFYRVSKTSMYIKPSLKMHKNLKISLQLGQQINQKTLPMTMKTWYCPLCLQYDCQKHKLQYRVSENDHQYISQKNKFNEIEHIQNIVKLLKFYERLKNQNLMEEEPNSKIDKACGTQCYLNIKKSDILRLNMKRFQLVTPLAKSLVKIGLELFSYNPCQINRIFQSKYEKNLSINCNLIFIHFTEECNLQELIHQKMKKSQKDLLLNQSDKVINMVKVPSNPMKYKRANYLEKRVKNDNPQFATCMHNFIESGSVDIKCQRCVCRERGFCLPTCLCTQYCEIKRIGCNCKGLDSCQAEKCICFINKLECSPGICGECFVTKHHPKKNNCRNDQVLRGIHKKVYIGISQIPGAGLGAFAGEDFSKNDLVCKYTGEHINSNIDAIREAMIKDLSFYNFDSPNGKASQSSIDARFMGNKARFINHGNQGENNVRAENIHSNGTQYIALFAAKQIKEGQQLRFNYDGSGNLYALHRDKYPFIKPPKKN